MGKITNGLAALVLAAFASLMPPTANAAIVNLGFAIDHSGSVSAANFALQQQGLANALALLPTTGDVQYRVSVITFGADVKTLVAPTLVTSAADITAIQSAIINHARTNTGSTQTASAIDQLVALFAGVSTLQDTLTLFNISTDGTPCCQFNAQQLAETAAANAVAAGVDGISVELVGSFTQTAINNMLALTSPNPSVYITDAANLPNPTEFGFVFGVANFQDYQAAIGAKIQRIVDDTGGGTPPTSVPEPASLALLLGALGLMGGRRLREKFA
jgi:hypothetical protein